MVRVVLVIVLAFLGPAAEAIADAPKGRPSYLRYCSSCHGEDADGKGPVANLLDPAPPDLRLLREKYGSPLGTRLVTFISGTTMPRAHGSSDMPVWGRVLLEEGKDNRDIAHTLWAIIGYLNSIQLDKTEAPKSSR